MTSTQTMSNHSTFGISNTSMLMTESRNDEISSNNSMDELETLSKFVSQRNLRNPSVPKMSLRSREITQQSLQKENTVATRDRNRRSEVSLQTSSENEMYMKNGLLSDK